MSRTLVVVVVANFVGWLTLGARVSQAQPLTHQPADRLEPGALPVLAGDPDVGLKFGAFGQLARFHDDVRPYAWSAQVLAIASVQNGATGTEFPYREVYAKFDFPNTGVKSLRLKFDFDYLRTTNYGYFGLGNASQAARLWDGFSPGTPEYIVSRHYYQYDGSAFLVRATSIERLSRYWQRIFALAIKHNRVGQYAGSLLQHDSTSGVGAGQTLWGLGEQTNLLLGLGVAYDSRDHETVTTRGMFHEFSLRADPGALGSDAYLGANLTLRGYVPFSGELLSLAGRAVGDVLSRRAPLSELSYYGGLYGGQGPGGSRGIRGVPQGRLLGRTKVIANLELRSLFLPFSIGSQSFCVGAASFFDAGRVWADPLASVPSLDGSPSRIHWGAGAGPRLRWGDSLLIRADIAYAPLGAQLGSAPVVYLDVDQVL